MKEVEEKMAQAARAGEAIDYLTFVPDGEPWTERLVPGVLWECSGWRAASCGSASVAYAVANWRMTRTVLTSLARLSLTSVRSPGWGRR